MKIIMQTSGGQVRGIQQTAYEVKASTPTERDEFRATHEMVYLLENEDSVVLLTDHEVQRLMEIREGMMK